MSSSSIKRTRSKIGHKVRSSSLKSEPADGRSGRQVLGKDLGDDEMKYKTMIAPPFEEDTMLSGERNSSSNCDKQFCGLKRADMRSGCDNDLDGLRNANNIRSVDSNIRFNKEVVVTKPNQVGETFPLPLSLSLSLDNNDDDNGSGSNGNHESSLNRSNLITSNERGEQEEETLRVGLHLSPLLSDNRRETRNRRRFNSLISSSELIESKQATQTKWLDSPRAENHEDDIRGDKDWLLSASAGSRSTTIKNIDKENEEIDELSPLQKVNKENVSNFNGKQIRERSSSITSDYFSSSHESPVIVSKANLPISRQQIGGKKCILSLFREPSSSDLNETKENSDKKVTKQVAEFESNLKVKKSTTIYENPLFVSNYDAKNDKTTTTHLRTKQAKKQGNKWHLKEEEEFKMKSERRDQANKGQERREQQNSSSSSRHKSGPSSSFSSERLAKGGNTSEEMLKSLR